MLILGFVLFVVYSDAYITFYWKGANQMPNYCENDLCVSGSKDKLHAFLECVGSEFDFETIVPYPAKYVELDKAAEEWHKLHPNGNCKDAPPDGFNQGGSGWRWNNWGTKWNAIDALIQNVNDAYVTVNPQATITFRTAWSPPLPVIEAASKRFPDLRFDLRISNAGAASTGCSFAKMAK